MAEWYELPYHHFPIEPGKKPRQEAKVLALFDKPDPLDGPFFEETIYVAPSRLHPEVLDAAIEQVAQACEVLGLEFELVRQPFVVGIQKGDPFRTRSLDSGVSCYAHAGVLLSDQAHLVAVFANDDLITDRTSLTDAVGDGDDRRDIDESFGLRPAACDFHHLQTGLRV